MGKNFLEKFSSLWITFKKLNSNPKKLRIDLTKKQSNLLQSHKSHQKTQKKRHT